MAYYLLDHSNTYKQYREVRRNGGKLSGVIDIHTTENYPDTVAPDLGAENCYAWITRRTDPGSYHGICDSDSIIWGAPLDYECWHDRFTNNHAIGLSMATRADDWWKLSTGYRDGMVDNLAVMAASVVQELSKRGITVPLRWLSQAEAHGRVPGFVTHGTSDPSRRHDPGAGFPKDYFLQRVGELLGSRPAPGPAPSTDSYLPLLVDGVFGHRTVTELQRALKRTGDYGGLIEADINRVASFGSVTASAYQRFLNRKGFYNEGIDGDFGRLSTWAEQNWLSTLGLYPSNAVDGKRGPVTIMGLQNALNAGKVA